MEYYEKLMNFKSNKPNFMDLVGVKITELSEGYSEAELEIAPDHLNFLGIVHGGCIFTLADIAAGIAAYSHGVTTVTLSSSFNFLSAAPDTARILKACAKTKKHGRTITVLDVDVYADDRLVATGTFTCFTTSTEPMV